MVYDLWLANLLHIRCLSSILRCSWATFEFQILSYCYVQAVTQYFVDISLSQLSCFVVNLQFLYRMKTNKLFEKLRRRDTEEEDILAIQHIYLDEESRLLAVAAAHHIVLFSFSKKETTKDISVCLSYKRVNSLCMTHMGKRRRNI